MAGLNVVALISGGKDSFFSILHCQANGHKIVALANLHPRAQDAEDLDSFMYQTIGHGVIPLYEQALGLPLYRQEIQGTAAVQDRDYHHSSTEDETESLLPLLRKVLSAHPEVNAISTGAILSDYQRTRVESVALRLGLTPLSYLWHWPTLPPQTQTSLLEDMTAVGQDSRIIKVASGGLDESYLWQNVAEPRTRLRLDKAAQRFGTSGDGAVLGEGGEFETLTISGPAPLWKGTICISPENITVVPGEAGSASVKISSAEVAIDVTKHSLNSDHVLPRIPSLLEDRFNELLESLCFRRSFEPDETVRAFSTAPDHWDTTNSAMQVLPNLTGPGETAVAQTKSIMDEAAIKLAQLGHSMHDVATTVIVLRDMSDFAAVNTIYGGYFDRPNPPARITIACADVLPTDARLSISFTIGTGKREGLHVQSRSYWAPANIGPYSQAIRLTGLNGANIDTYVAGQIPLMPASMQLPERRSKDDIAHFATQSVLALQHLGRIGRVMKVKRWTFGIAFLASSGLDRRVLALRAGIARHTWKEFHAPLMSISPAEAQSEEEDDTNFDVWDQQHGSGRRAWQSSMPLSKNIQDSDETSDQQVPCMLVVTADSLPKAADIEWVGFASEEKAVHPVVPAHLAALLKTFEHRILPLGQGI
ncbi:Putative diphthamide synthase domain, YjgF/YER057c/UK114 family, RutC-like superfamily [Septoria linicola]|uniref:Diphthine--ammonia ligase n=1 Tax=Septoria linicola TaxID=215465 RepID=A0A9Q9EPA2_9PEZI|nr:putative diphthamide synthase domain, YjgF/YER057c/UK114 family, RutC-like superfamily [Septoria linicola]USW57482.1 Putative diphthamide synthase domain, YjgF/YER057c/UK114 family, RutC-like superfamily [Septoria linicola]